MMINPLSQSSSLRSNSNPDSLIAKRTKKRVLVLEDEPDVSLMTCYYLRHAGFEAVPVKTLELADAEVEEQHPDAVLLDLNLPDGDGLSYLASFKNLHPDIPVVIYTSEDYDESQLDSVIDQGASGFISKYMEASHVVATLRRVLNQSGF